MLYLTILGWLLVLLWLWYSIPLGVTLATRWLALRAAGLNLTAWPRLSVIVPARNEGRANVEAGLRSLAAVDYPDLEIVAIDDRSTDDTGAAMDDVARESSRIRVVHVTALPEGWLGKNHALHSAGMEARGEWILFTDGDVRFAPNALRLALAYVENSGSGGRRPIDFLCLAPDLETSSFLERSLVSFFGFLLMSMVQPIFFHTRLPFAYCGVGAFNLVRRSAWLSVGGHERIRLDVLDDVNLGKLMKCAGHRCEMLFAGDLVRVRWQDSLWGVIRGLEKNSFASMQYSLGVLTCGTAFIVAAVFGPYLGVILALLLRNPAAALPSVVAAALMHGMFAWYGYQNKAGWTVTLSMPFVAVLFLFACWRSAWITLQQGGVRWRDTFYSLKELRANRFKV